MTDDKGILSAGRPSERTRKVVTLASVADNVATKRINFEISADQHLKLRLYALRSGKTIKDLLTEYILSLPEQK